MTERKNLLIEIGTEELPPKALLTLSESFTQSIQLQLDEARLEYHQVESFATPRRLAVLVHEVQTAQDDEIVEKRGPSVDAAYDASGEPTKAALGWARGMGIELDQAERYSTEKGEWLLHKAVQKGKSIESLLPDIVAVAAKQLPVPKTMRWGNGDAAFIRPVHTLTIMLDDKVVPASLFGISSSNTVTGHRFHHPEPVALSSANDYESALRAAHVIACFEERKSLIDTGIASLAAKENAVPVYDDALLDEVTALVEWPVALAAEFDQAFLAVPKEALIYTMKDDQRYFPLLDDDGKLLSKFIFITNIDSKDPEQVIQGNEKVVRPRLADAQFFFESDKHHTLESRIDKLNTVLFQKQLGSIGDKARRLESLSRSIANALRDESADAAARAGLLAKADLVTHMVMEFPEVQGVMGMHYAINDGEEQLVAEAIRDHYLPRFAGDDLPESIEGCAVALADKLDTLAGIFGIGQIPKGDRDPFALRRAAIGLLRILVEKSLPLDLEWLVGNALEGYGDKIKAGTEVQEQIVDFLLGRFRNWYQDEGFSVDVIQSVLACRPTQPVDFDLRVRAVASFRNTEEAESLAAANKRISNILAKADNVGDSIDESLFEERAEKGLYSTLQGIQKEVDTAIESGSYERALTSLATLQAPVDSFFDNVMVNADDERVKQNRLAILQQLRSQFLKVADISLLQG